MNREQNNEEEVKPVNEEGPAGTYGCACVASDAWRCAAARRITHRIACECLCHLWRELDARKPQ